MEGIRSERLRAGSGTNGNKRGTREGKETDRGGDAKLESAAATSHRRVPFVRNENLKKRRYGGIGIRHEKSFTKQRITIILYLPFFLKLSYDFTKKRSILRR